MQVTGLIHDLGKPLYFYDTQGQWDVVGDTFPGCAFRQAYYLPRHFQGQPRLLWSNLQHQDRHLYQRHRHGLSWGHDEYLYDVVKDQSALSDEALAMIRCHSFYSWHKEGAHRWMMDEKDETMLDAVKRSTHMTSTARVKTFRR